MRLTGLSINAMVLSLSFFGCQSTSVGVPDGNAAGKCQDCLLPLPEPPDAEDFPFKMKAEKSPY
jgi:hypothetical protein